MARRFPRTARDIPVILVFGGLVLIFLVLGFATPINPSGFLGAMLAVIFAFFFVTVSHESSALSDQPPCRCRE